MDKSEPLTHTPIIKITYAALVAYSKVPIRFNVTIPCLDQFTFSYCYLDHYHKPFSMNEHTVSQSRMLTLCNLLISVFVPQQKTL